MARVEVSSPGSMRGTGAKTSSASVSARPVSPVSMAEIRADKDRLRAEFAMSTRRLEMSVEQLKGKTEMDALVAYLQNLGTVRSAR